jgi:hypothetical protein
MQPLMKGLNSRLVTREQRGAGRAGLEQLVVGVEAAVEAGRE